MAFLSDDGNGSLSTAVDTSWGAVKIGLYARHLDRWLRHYPRDRFHFVSGERLITDPAREMALLQVIYEHSRYDILSKLLCASSASCVGIQYES